jgi:hypothetical protein
MCFFVTGDFSVFWTVWATPAAQVVAVGGRAFGGGLVRKPVPRANANARKVVRYGSTEEPDNIIGGLTNKPCQIDEQLCLP